MADTIGLARRGRRRALAALAATVTALGAAGTGVAMAASSDGPAKAPTKDISSNAVHPFNDILGSKTTIPANGGYVRVTVTCPAGELVYGGGEANDANGTVFLTDSGPSGTNGWYAYVKNTGITDQTAEAVAVCY